MYPQKDLMLQDFSREAQFLHRLGLMMDDHLARVKGAWMEEQSDWQCCRLDFRWAADEKQEDMASERQMDQGKV